MGGGSKKRPGRPNKRRLSAQESRGAESGKRAHPGHFADERIDKAQQAWARRQFDEAIRLYERALERQPTNAVLLVDLARAYALRFRHAEAEALVDRACRLHPEDGRLQRMLGRSYIQLQQFDRAIECFRRALELDPQSAERARSLYELAHMYERLHRLDEARACANESLGLAPEQPVLKYLLGRIAQRGGDSHAARVRFEEVIAAGRGTPQVLADSWYQLAAIHDSEGRFDEAFEASAQAKRILNNVAGPMKYDAADMSAISRRTLRTVSGDHLERWAELGKELSPLGGGLALLTSHPRSGTTLLEQVLDSHPGLISADELQVMAEVVYLPLCRTSAASESVPEILNAAPQAAIDGRRQAYWSAMEGSLRQSIGPRMLLDKNPALTGLLPVVGRVFPEMKVLFALRDPRDVVVSCYFQQLPMNAVSVHYLTLEETANEYAATMRTWLKLRNVLRNPWLEVRYEETVADLTGQARRVLEFLGLPWDDAVLDYRRQAALKHVHSPTYEAVTRPLYTQSIGRWRHYADRLSGCFRTLAPYVEAFGYEST
jgi:tetratricopeptide (TPR) repeat protein